MSAPGRSKRAALPMIAARSPQLPVFNAGCALLAAALLAGCVTTAQREPEGAPPPAPGEPLAESDLALADATVVRALETGLSGEHFAWSNPATGHSGEVWVTRTYRLAGGGWCREYREAIRAGEHVDGYADRACRATDGEWVIVE